MSSSVNRRATTVEGIKQIRARFDNSAGKLKGLAYQPSDTDVFIATYPKCGTTWLQQMLNCLRTNGDMSFDEITLAVPWLEMAAAMGIDPTAPQQAEPKVFKTHLSYEEMPAGGRYVHMIRDPADVLVSMYHFHEGWFFEPDSISLDDYALEHFLEGGRSGGYWDFQASWWPHRNDPNVLYLVYEEALAEPLSTIRRVAEFAGIPVDQPRLELCLERSGIEFMKQHGRQFDDHALREVTNAYYHLPSDSTTTKVRSGRSGAGRARLSQVVIAALGAQWERVMDQRFGLDDYSALRAAAR